jgi:formate hydrogenlyase subunit 3/multisubunit Na+/H+ antiporter MnhD subunit
MIEVTTSLALLLAVTWPLLLAVGLAFGATRSVALRLVPWAALPALATVATLADTGLRLPGAMLGSALVLDGMGRVFLLLSAFLWLATGLLARPQLHNAGANRFAVLQLLAMTGAFGLALAADALLFFTAATLAGYALYGLLVHEANVSAQKAGRVLVVLLVVSDLLVFELLLMLGQAAGSVDFPSLRQAFVDSGNQGLMLGLLIVGFGIKTGVVGVHFWLAPVFVTSVTAVRPALISFIFSAGLLGWLRLLPLGDIHDIHWTGAGAVLQWLAWVTLGYAVFVGLLQAHFRSVLAYTAIALSGFWVATLGSALLYPQAWNGMAESTHAAVLQSGFALAALLLLDWRTGGCAPAWLRRISTGVMWLATFLLAAAPVGITGSLAKVDGMAAVQMSCATAAIAFLVIRGLLLIGPPGQGARDMSTSLYVMQQPAQAPTTTSLLVAGGLAAAALLAAAYNLAGLSLSELLRPAMVVSAAALVAWLSAERRVPRLTTLPPGDLLVPISRGLSQALTFVRRLADEQLPRWCDAWLVSLGRPWSNVDWWGMVERIDFGLTRWRTVLVVLLLLGLMVAWCGRNG